MPVLLELNNVTKYFNQYEQGSTVKLTALDNISFVLQQGEIIGILGENGSGKSTLAKLLAGLYPPSSGKIYIQGELQPYSQNVKAHPAIRLVGQTPDTTFNPRYRIRDILLEPLKINTTLSLQQQEQQVKASLMQVGLPTELRHAYPYHLATGQKQRIAFARALISKPRLVIADDVCAALDLAIEAQIINLMLKLQKEYQLSYLYISQDIQLTRHISDKILVMHKGKIVEQGPTETIFNHPQHTVTQRLLYDYFGDLSQ